MTPTQSLRRWSVISAANVRELGGSDIRRVARDDGIAAVVRICMDYRKEFIVAPGNKLRLAEIDPAYKGHENPRDRGAGHRRLPAEIDGHAVAALCGAEALRTGGAAGARCRRQGRHDHPCHGRLQSQGATVTRFQSPTPEELAHDFLWRVHTHTPRRGEIAVFNRSQYEDVLVTRVHKLIDNATCETRLKQIREFEAELVDSGTQILKFFLHISKEEQLARFAQRLDDPKRNWKISESDYTERAYWDDYVDGLRGALVPRVRKAPVVRDPVQSQMVPQSRGLPDPR